MCRVSVIEFFINSIDCAELLVEFFGINKFDVVISTEMLENVKDWRIVINNLKEVLKPGGIIYNYSLKRFWISRLSI